MLCLYTSSHAIPAATVGLWVITSFQCSLICIRPFIWVNICPINIWKVIIRNMRKFKYYSLVEVPPRYLMMLSRAICKQISIFNNKSIILWVIVVWLTCRQAWIGPLRGESWGTCLRHKQFHSDSPPPPCYTILSIYLPSTPLFIISLSLPFDECCPFLLFIFFFFFLISNISDVKVSESKPVFCLWEQTILTFT